MERTISIDDKPVKFRCTAKTVAVYRDLFNRELFDDISKLQNIQDEKTYGMAQVVFERIAFAMAKHADPSIPDSIEDWLDQFEMFSIYTALPEIVKMWEVSGKTISVPKKKATSKRTGR